MTTVSYQKERWKHTNEAVFGSWFRMKNGFFQLVLLWIETST
jgi:hypothetical protein